jgi:hypothetical protein
MRKAALVDFRVHDLRHSAAIAHGAKRGKLAEIAQLLDIGTFGMTRRYSHVHTSTTLSLVDRVMDELPRETTASNKYHLGFPGDPGRTKRCAGIASTTACARLAWP